MHLLVTILLLADQAVVLKAAHLFDSKSGKVVSPGVVVVQGGKITAVGKAESGPVIDLGDATLLPGFMDAHTHLSGEATDDWKQDRIDRFRLEVPEQTLASVERLRKTLWGGFTTVRDLGSNDFIDVGQRNAIAAGKIVGPRMLVAVNAIGVTGGHCDRSGYRFNLHGGHEAGIDEGIGNGPDALRAAVRFNVKYGADVIKVCATGGVLSLTDAVDTPQLTQAELDAIVDEAHALRKKTAAHAHGAEGAKRAIRAGIDSIEHGSFLDDEALDLMKKRGTYLVPTLSAVHCVIARVAKANMPPAIVAKANAANAAIHSTFQRALKKGVKIALGTDAAVCPHGHNADELRYMVELGMPAAQALRAGTWETAQLLGVGDKLGSLEAGKIADVIAVPGDPTRDISAAQKVFFVMKDGIIQRNDRH